jgi:CHAT domain-containing protein
MRKTASWFRLILPAILTLSIPCLPYARPPHSPDDTGNIQRHLRTDEVILEYILTDSSVQVNAISQESTYFTVQSLDRLFWCSLNAFRKKLRSADPRDFLIPGEILYLFLIKPLQDFLTGRRRLIIIPDDRLSGIPFEAFIRSDSLFRGNNICDLRYLIEDFEVVYHSSMRSWNERTMTAGNKHPATADDCQFAFMGFSPEFNKNKQVAALPCSGREIIRIGELFRQKGLSSWLVCNESSMKDYFKKIACRGRIVHLATHYLPCKSGCHPGGFLFSGYNPVAEKDHIPEGILTMDEMKVLQLDADLFVLNACSSGVDRLKSGTSYHSLPQLLLMAGARNILSTLWNVTDNLAENFMLDFYRLWLSGKTYSEALREVKLQWISCNATAIPTIWAPYVLMGE